MIDIKLIKELTLEETADELSVYEHELLDTVSGRLYQVGEGENCMVGVLEVQKDGQFYCMAGNQECLSRSLPEAERFLEEFLTLLVLIQFSSGIKGENTK